MTIKKRVPRAPNLKHAKLFLKKIAEKEALSVEEFRLIGKGILESDYAQYSDEYLNFLLMTDFIKRITKMIVIPKETREIVLKFSDHEQLTQYEKDIFRKKLLENNMVKWFIQEIFGYNIKNKKWIKKGYALDLDDIVRAYTELTGLSSSTSRREAKLFKDWLRQIGLINQSYTGRYFLTLGEVTSQEFIETFKNKYSEYEKSGATGTKWVEIAPIEASICEKFNISKEEFDKNFKTLVELYRGVISTSPGSAGLEEVRRFGVEINNKLIYYIKFDVLANE